MIEVNYQILRNGTIVMESCGRKQRYLYYTVREAYRRFKELLGVKRAKLVKVDYLGSII